MTSYVILTSKAGKFRTEAVEGLRPVESYDYLFCGRPRARFVIAELSAETKVRIVEEGPAPAVNLVPTKFLPRFDSLEKARAELRQLVRFGGIDMKLEKA